MIPELGNFALILALLVALVQGTLPLIGAQRGNAAWVALARPAAYVLFLLVAIAFACLSAAFVANDFSVLYVAEHSNSKLPLIYRLSAVWGGHEGSLLLWVLMLSLWGMAVAAVLEVTGEAPDAAVLDQHCASLPGLWRPKQFRVVTALPRTALGKLRRRDL